MDHDSLLAIVTGAGRGIGRAIVERLAGEGFRLELANLDAAELDATAASLPTGCVVGRAAFDLRDRAATAAWCAELASRHPRLDVLVLNAGVGGPDGDDDAAALAHLRNVIEVNAGAVLRVVRELAPRIRDDGRGRIVVTASVLGKFGVAGFSAYCASKAAVIGLVRALALELARRRITVNCVCPGWTDTAMAAQGFEAIAAATGTSVAAARLAVERALPLGRIVRPEEVAGLISFLVGKDAGAMSGQAVTMSAGDVQR